MTFITLNWQQTIIKAQ